MELASDATGLNDLLVLPRELRDRAIPLLKVSERLNIPVPVSVPVKAMYALLSKFPATTAVPNRNYRLRFFETRPASAFRRSITPVAYSLLALSFHIALNHASNETAPRLRRRALRADMPSPPNSTEPKRNIAPGRGVATADRAKPRNASGPPSDGPQAAGTPAAQPTVDDNPARNPDEPDPLGAACSAGVRSNTASSLPFCRPSASKP